MRNVLYAPKLTSNLFSVSVAVAKGNVVSPSCWIRDSKGKLIGMGSLDKKLHKLNCEPVVQQSASVAPTKCNSADLWHRKLGHISKQQLKEIASKELMKGISILKDDELSFCE